MLLLLQMTALLLFAQTAPNNPKAPEFIDRVREQKTINGYTVRLLPTAGGGYGFDILQNNKPVVHQFQNPLPYAPKGVQKKDDAYKIALWMITQYRAKRRWEPMMPPHVARNLKIATN
jgi:hypothetical protein